MLHFNFSTFSLSLLLPRFQYNGKPKYLVRKLMQMKVLLVIAFFFDKAGISVKQLFI